MNTWTNDELTKMNAIDELHLATMKQDGTLRNPVTIWFVCVNNEFYIRAVKGPTGLWYRHAIERHEGHIDAGGVTKNITFTEVRDENIMKEIDESYQSKYSNYGAKIVTSTVTPQARAATFKLIPREQ